MADMPLGPLFLMYLILIGAPIMILYYIYKWTTDEYSMNGENTLKKITFISFGALLSVSIFLAIHNLFLVTITAIINFFLNVSALYYFLTIIIILLIILILVLIARK
jgi:hypothetical protein